MAKVTPGFFSKRKLKFKPQQNPKPERFFEEEQNTQEQKPMYASILRKTSKTNLK